MLIASNAEVILVVDKKPNKQESFDILASFFVDRLHVLQSFSVSWSTITSKFVETLSLIVATSIDEKSQQTFQGGFKAFSDRLSVFNGVARGRDIESKYLLNCAGGRLSQHRCLVATANVYKSR